MPDLSGGIFGGGGWLPPCSLFPTDAHPCGQLERDGPGFRATFDTPEGPKVVRAKSVSVTAPTRVAAEVCAGLVPAASDLARAAMALAPPQE